MFRHQHCACRCIRIVDGAGKFLHLPAGRINDLGGEDIFAFGKWHAAPDAHRHLLIGAQLRAIEVQCIDRFAVRRPQQNALPGCVFDDDAYRGRARVVRGVREQPVHARLLAREPVALRATGRRVGGRSALLAALLNLGRQGIRRDGIAGRARRDIDRLAHAGFGVRHLLTACRGGAGQTGLRHWSPGARAGTFETRHGFDCERRTIRGNGSRALLRRDAIPRGSR